MGVEWVCGVLDNVTISRRRPRLTVKMAFIFGSSKHGKTRRASVGSICEVIRYLCEKSDETVNLHNKSTVGTEMEKEIYILLDTVLCVA